MIERIHRFVTDIGRRIEDIEIRFHEAYWRSQIEASEANDSARAELELQLRELKGDPVALEKINAALAEEIHDPLLRRQLEVLRLSFTANQMNEQVRQEIVSLSTQIESDFSSFRAQVGDRRLSDNEIDDVLKHSDDVDERKDVWQASKQVGGAVADRVRELVRLRNATARELGYADYYQMSLELQELEEPWLFDVMQRLEKVTDEPFEAWKNDLDERLRERFSTTDLYPWHYADPFFQSLPPDGRVTLDDALGGLSAEELAIETFARWDIDLRDVMGNSDLYPRERKCQHAFCLDVDRKGDVRILANVVPSERWIETMLHESGHAAYDICIDKHLPYLLRRPCHIFVTEAIALLSGRMTRDPVWLKDIAGVAANEVDALADDLRAANAAQSLQFARWGLVMVHFERDLYADPEADLDDLWWRHVEHFQRVKVPREEAPEGAWAAKIHIAAAPVYYQNYLLGDLLASQLATTARERFGGIVGSAEAGHLLKEKVFTPGNSATWREVIVGATDHDLDPGHLAAELTR
ncbi:MAG: M2 family metallopeptidase [Actinomycetota bacterium]